MSVVGMLGSVGRGEAAVVSVRPLLSVSERYEDNIDRVPDNRREELTTSVGTGLAVDAQALRWSAAADYRLGVNFYARETQEQGEVTHLGTLAAAFRVSRFTEVHVGDSLRIGRAAELAAGTGVDPATDLGPDAAPDPGFEPITLPTRRVRRVDNAASVSLTHDVSASSSIAGTYSFRVVRFGSSDFVDSDEHRFRLVGRRQVSLNDRLGLEYRASAIWYEDEADEDFVQEVRATWGRRLAQGTDMGLGVGTVWNDRGDAQTALVGDLSIRRTVGRTRYAVVYDTGFTGSDGTGVTQRVDGLEGNVTHDLTRTLTGRLGVGVARSENITGASEPTYRVLAIAGLRAALGRWAVLNGAYSYQRKDAPVRSQSYYVNAVTVSVSFLLPVVAAFRI